MCLTEGLSDLPKQHGSFPLRAWLSNLRLQKELKARLLANVKTLDSVSHRFLHVKVKWLSTNEIE